LIIEIQNEVPQVVGLRRQSKQRTEDLGNWGKWKRKHIVEIDEDE
jgi:hypothetical protein